MDRARAEQWIRTNAASLRCPVCGSNNFALDDTVAMTNSLQDDGHVNYLSGIPLVFLACQNCAHVLFFSAKQMGVA